MNCTYAVVYAASASMYDGLGFLVSLFERRRFVLTTGDETTTSAEFDEFEFPARG